MTAQCMPAPSAQSKRLHFTTTTLGCCEYLLAEGEGPVVLLIHGGEGGGYDQAALLGEWLERGGFRLLAPSRPGYLGTPLASGRSFVEQADLLAALLQQLAIERVAVVATSLGGPVGYLLAQRYPERVAALVAIDAVSGYYQPPPTIQSVADPLLFRSPVAKQLWQRLSHTTDGSDLLLRLFADASAHSELQFRRQLVSLRQDPAAIALLQQLLVSVADRALRDAGEQNDLRQYRRHSALPLSQIKVPSLIIHATHNSDVPFYHGIYAYESIAGSEYHWLAQAHQLGFWIGAAAAAAQQRALQFLASRSG